MKATPIRFGMKGDLRDPGLAVLGWSLDHFDLEGGLFMRCERWSTKKTYLWQKAIMKLNNMKTQVLGCTSTGIFCYVP